MFGFGKPSRSKFAQIVTEAARKAGVTGDLAFDEAEFTLKGEKRTVFLGNVYAHYCAADRKQKQKLLGNFVSALAHGEDGVAREQAFEQCGAVVRQRALFAFMELHQGAGRGKPPAVVFEPISEWFVQALVIDSPGSMRIVSSGDLKDWDVTFEDLSQAGLIRLRDCSPVKFQQQDGYFVGTWKDDYDSSRILLEDLFTDLPIEGTPVFCIPNRLTLMVADSSKEDVIQAMLTRAEEIVQTEPQPENSSPLTFVEGKITDYMVPPSSKLFQAVQRARGITRIMYYGEQKELLEELHQKSGKDIHVGQFTLIQNNEGNYSSYCVWSKGVTSLLPKTDLVMFHDPDKPDAERTIPVKWEEAFKVVSDLMLDAEMFPPRFYVSKFPSPEQVARLPKVAK